MAPARRPQPARANGIATAVALSAVGHAVVLAALSNLERPSPSPVRPLEVELIELPGPAATVPPAAAASPTEAAASPTEARATRAVAAPRSRSLRPAPPAPPAAAVASPTDALRSGEAEARPPGQVAAALPSGGDAAPALPRAVDLAAEGLAVGPPARPSPDLRPRLRPSPPAGAAMEPGAGVAAPPDPLRGLADDVSGRARVASGLAHPYWSSVGKALVVAWDAQRVLEARGISGYLAQAAGNLKSFARVWQRVAEQYGRAGAAGPLDGSSERLRELAGLPAGPASEALAAAELDRQLQGAIAEERISTVRVTQERDGTIRSVELVSPSRDAEVDREALAAVRKAVATLAAPPPEALGERGTLVTTWAFEVEVSITPPEPVIGIDFDEVLGFKDLRVPLDRRIYKRVRLVAVN